MPPERWVDCTLVLSTNCRFWIIVVTSWVAYLSFLFMPPESLVDCTLVLSTSCRFWIIVVTSWVAYLSFLFMPPESLVDCTLVLSTNSRFWIIVVTSWVAYLSFLFMPPESLVDCTLVLSTSCRSSIIAVTSWAASGPVLPCVRENKLIYLHFILEHSSVCFIFFRHWNNLNFYKYHLKMYEDILVSNSFRYSYLIWNIWRCKRVNTIPERNWKFQSLSTITIESDLRNLLYFIFEDGLYASL